ncbi:MAG: hypothetical protein J2P36_12515 [Ktedonobacteraceae bacterium]|nr:hypothetical protein [Ktedonobacteraceae bacterium]
METPIPETPPVPNADITEEAEHQPTQRLSAITKPHRAAPPEKSAGATAEEIERLETQQVPAVSGKEQTIEDQETQYLPATSDLKQKQEALEIQRLPAASSTAQGVEHLQTQRLPTAPKQTEMEHLPTQRLSAVSGENMQAATAASNGLFATARRLINIGLTRLQEPQPEGLFTRGFLQVVKPDLSLGLFPLLTLTNALGLILVSISYYLGQFGGSALEFSFLLGILIIFVPNLLRLLSPIPLRLERIGLLCGLGLSFYLIAYLMSPLHVSEFDEFLHWFTADDILRTGHLFGNNSMLPVGPYYPGLEIVTNAISSLTGLNTFYASIPLIAATRLLLTLSLFLFYEQITSSSRMAGIATIIYMVNPHFIFFDAMYSYETLALPLTICALYILARYENIGGEHRWIIFTSWIVLIAVTFTHHMTDIVFDGLLFLWFATSFFAATPRKTRLHLGTLAIFGVVLAVAYALLTNGNPVWSYLSSYFDIAFAELGRILAGVSSSRPLFTSTGTDTSPLWDRLLMTGSVGIVALSLPFGLLTLWQLYRRFALPLMLGIFALAYPIAQAFRFTNFGPEISDRSTAFLFLSVAYVLTILITHFWPTRKLSKRAIALITCAISAVLLGGIILDAGPNYTDLPGPYTVGADRRSLEPEGINAALWTLSNLGPDNRIGTDRTNQMLLSTYGDQRIVTELDDQVEVSPIFYSTQFDEADIELLQAGKIHYLVVDMRLSTSVPALGFYFVSDEPEANHITTPISRTALTKFDTIPDINRLFDSGNIAIYDTGAFLDGPDS